jgi:hypothetical protein
LFGYLDFNLDTVLANYFNSERDSTLLLVLYLVYVNEVNILGGSIHKIKKKTIEALEVASKEIGLEANTNESMRSFREVGMQDKIAAYI